MYFDQPTFQAIHDAVEKCYITKNEAREALLHALSLSPPPQAYVDYENDKYTVRKPSQVAETVLADTTHD